MENWNVEASSEILPRWEKIGIMENWNNNIVKFNTLCAMPAAQCTLPTSTNFCYFQGRHPLKEPIS
jgi:hypothetical protein